MFSSNNNNININPFPQLPFPSSSSTSFQAPFTDAEAAGFFPAFHNHDPGQLLAGYLVPAGGNYHTNAPNPQQGLVGNMGAWPELGGEKNRSGGDGKKPVRKDRHSKISTSQGLRDRRVRLSIGISREFFDLQDMLGFDTASKTLEWLLGKSKKDIQELEEQLKNRRENANNNNSSSDEDEEGVKKARASEKDVFAKESRAKARERARERTREKMCTSSPAATPTKCPPPNHFLHLHHRHRNQESNLYDLTQPGSHNMASFSRVDHNRPAEEAFVIQRKFMNSKGFVDWDISNAIRRSTICSTNLSTELQMYGNP